MSHFIGLVFLRPDADLDDVLAPFNEQDEKYMEFVDKTDEVKEGFAKLRESCPSEGTFMDEIDRTEMINQIWDEAPDSIAPEDEDEFWKPYTKKDFPTPADIAKDKKYDIVPDESQRNGVRFVQRVEREWQYEPSKEKYPTIDKYADGCFGYEKVNGRYGYYSNPNAKYDWYTDGGRWDGYLINSEGANTNEEMLTEVDWDKTDVPFCFVNAEGEWIEKGEMGWWGMVSNEKKQVDWNAEFKAYIQSLLADEDADKIEVVAVDFHI